MSTPRTRTPAQTAASKRNATRSTGPVTAVGKAIASTNGTVHGLASRGILLPGEAAEQYQANLDAWLETIHPGTPGEGHLVARVADVAWRLGRLAQLEERLVNAAVDRRVAASSPAKSLQTAREARQAVQGLAVLAGEVRTPRAAEDVAKLAPALRFVVELLGRTEVGVAVQVAVEKGVGALLEERYGDVEPATFQALAAAARGAEEALTAEVGRLQAAVDVERDKLANDVLFADEADAKVIDRHRGRLGRELAALLENLRRLRELAVPPRGREEQPAVPVELRVVGRGGRRDRAGLLETGEVRTNGPPLSGPAEQSQRVLPEATRRALDLVRPPSLSPCTPVAPVDVTCHMVRQKRSHGGKCVPGARCRAR